MNVTQEARQFRSLAADAIEDSVHAAKRAVKLARRGVDEIGDLRDEAAHRVKREPLKAVGVALGAGILLGVAATCIGRAAVRVR